MLPKLTIQPYPKGPKIEEYDTGDEVYWESQAAGSRTRKQGVIVWASTRPIPEWLWKDIAAGRQMFENCSEGIVVLVERGEGKKPYYYAPRLKSLHHINEK